MQNAVREYIERKSCRQGALFSSEAPKSCIARISCHPRRPRAAPLSLFAISDAVSCHPPVAPHPSPSASQSAAVSALPAPRSLPQLPPPSWPFSLAVCRSFRTPCCLFGPTVRRRFRTPVLPCRPFHALLARHYRDSCVVAGAGNVQRPFVGVG